MIEKLNGLRHLKVSSSLKKEPNGGQQDQNKKESKRDQSQDKTNEPHEHFDVSPFDIDIIIQKLNANHYYQKKGMKFEFHSTNDGDVVTVKSNNKIVQRMAPSKAYDILKRISVQNEDSPIKGGILNVNI